LTVAARMEIDRHRRGVKMLRTYFQQESNGIE
jgi:hypothetical protein